MLSHNEPDAFGDDAVADDWRITAYVFDQLDAEDRAAVDRLMKQNDGYRHAVEETRQLARQLHGQPIQPPAMSNASINRVEAAIDELSPTTSTGSQLGIARKSVLLAMATAATVTIVGGLWWLNTSPIQGLVDNTGLEADGGEANDINMLVPKNTSPTVRSRPVRESTPGLVDSITPSSGAPLRNMKVQESGQPGSVVVDKKVSQPDSLEGTLFFEREEQPSPGMDEDHPYGPPNEELGGHKAPQGLSKGMGMGMGMESRGQGGMGMGGMRTPNPGQSGMGGYGYAEGMMGGTGYGYNDDRPRSAPDDVAERGRYAVNHQALGDRYASITDNPFQMVADQPLSTFSIDVDTASYSQIRMMLQKYSQRPNPDAVRIEEMLNYFAYDYNGPEGDVPFAANMELAACPWNEQHRLARIAIKGREVETDKRSVSNLVFLMDVSGSMNEPNKLPLVRQGLEMLVQQLSENDRVAIVVYAGAAGMVLDSTTADQKQTIFAALDQLQAGGSTNGAQGITLAYQIARDHYIPGGTNRVILCTDGDFNVGVTGTEDLASIVQREAKGGVFLTVLGFGSGNLNDAMLEAISGRGDGNYAFIDSTTEARKVLVQQLSGTLVTIAKDVKIQIEFNPGLVESYRLIGYENRILAAKDFADDTKDAGEIGAGHTVTALYEIVPAGLQKPYDNLKYQPKPQTEVIADEPYGNELLTLKLRYKEPEGGASKLLEFPIQDSEGAFEEASEDYRFAAAVAGFGMLLRNSPHRGSATYDSMRQIARGAVGDDQGGLRSEMIGLIDLAK